jgi:hypothetical protein
MVYKVKRVDVHDCIEIRHLRMLRCIHYIVGAEGVHLGLEARIRFGMA